MQANYETASRHLSQLEARRAAYPTRDLDERIERLRKEVADLRAQGGMRESDPQAELLSLVTFGILEKRQVRMALVALFGLMVEAGAALGLFAALAHLSELPKVSQARTEASTLVRGANRVASCSRAVAAAGTEKETLPQVHEYVSAKDTITRRRLRKQRGAVSISATQVAFT